MSPQNRYPLLTSGLPEQFFHMPNGILSFVFVVNVGITDDEVFGPISGELKQVKNHIICSSN